jgi:diguanylate cyclase (GGDEF)-like protein
MRISALSLPITLTAAVAGTAVLQGAWLYGALAVLALFGGTLASISSRRRERGGPRAGTRTIALATDPRLLELKRHTIADELRVLEDAQDLQRGVFEVSAELVGCVEEGDARVRFTSAMRRYWSCSQADLLVWERGSWRSLGGEASGPAPVLGRPVALPEEDGGDLVLDLSPGVDGQAALVLRQTTVQPSLLGRTIADQRYVAEVLRTQLSLSLRRVTLYGGLQSLARIDPLTGTNRRWYGEARLRELVDAGEVVAVAMVDIDYFKRVNDEFGHAGGDAVLSAVGCALMGHLRAGDLVCRYGGEEFLVILPDTPPKGAAHVSERLRASVAALTTVPRQVTVSIGLAACHQDETAEVLIGRADAALYRAKEQGRNRVELVDDELADSFLRTTARKNRKAHGSDTGLRRAVRPDPATVQAERAQGDLSAAPSSPPPPSSDPPPRG